MRIIRKEISREKAEYMERLNFELQFNKDIIQRIIEGHQNDSGILESEAFKHYQQKGVDLQAEYKIACTELERTEIPPAILEHKHTWEIPANSCELVIKILCNCEIKGVENETV